MFDLRELLKEVGDRASRATEGPWDYQPWSQYALPSGDYAESILLANASDDGEIIRGLRDEDGEFVAHARTDVPALVAALEAVLTVAETHRFKGKGLPDDMPDEHETVADSVASEIIRAVDDALGGS